MIEYRLLEPSEIQKIHDIDRTEKIRTGYAIENGVLKKRSVNWDSVRWREGDGNYSYGRIIGSVRECLANGGSAIGAFDAERLVGIATYRPNLQEGMGHLELLHITNGYRRRGIASRLFEDILRLARRDGADRLYVSATPTESAVSFYSSHEFLPTATPDPTLFEEEPDDIHMILELR